MKTKKAEGWAVCYDTNAADILILVTRRNVGKKTQKYLSAQLD